MDENVVAPQGLHSWRRLHKPGAASPVHAHTGEEQAALIPHLVTPDGVWHSGVPFHSAVDLKRRLTLHLKNILFIFFLNLSFPKFATLMQSFVPSFILKTAFTFELQLLSNRGLWWKYHQYLNYSSAISALEIDSSTQSIQNKQSLWQALTQFTAKRLYSQPE